MAGKPALASLRVVFGETDRLPGGWFQRLSAMAEGAPAGESPSSHTNSTNQHSLNLLTDLALGAGADLSEDVQPSPAAQEQQSVEPYSPNHPEMDGLALPFINFDDLLAFTRESLSFAYSVRLKLGRLTYVALLQREPRLWMTRSHGLGLSCKTR